ncbi:MAG: hypothetical protein N2V75_08545 [Methanophagales archaeon]|nr:hypothetical protein [Methanophagales archaeon]
MDRDIFEEDTMTLEKILGYSFSDKNFLNRALTRKAYELEQKQRNPVCEDQEIFSTLDDAVSLVVVALLLKQAPIKIKEVRI